MGSCLESRDEIACLFPVWPPAKYLQNNFLSTKVKSKWFRDYLAPCLCLTWGCKGENTEQIRTSLSLRAWEWFSFCFPQTDTCCLNWQVGSWSRSPILLVCEPEPWGRIHFTLCNPWVSVGLLQSSKCRTKTTLLILCHGQHCLRTTTNIFKIRLIRVKVILTLAMQSNISSTAFKGPNFASKEAHMGYDTNAGHT